MVVFYSGCPGSDGASTPGNLVFYNYPLAFNPAKARLALEEKGLKVTITFALQRLNIITITYLFTVDV